MLKSRIAIVIGSTRDTRFADQPAAWIEQIAKTQGVLPASIRNYWQTRPAMREEVA